MIKSLEQGCALDFSPACTSAAAAYAEGALVKKDARKAFALARKVCTRVSFPPSFEACGPAAEWARDGVGTKKDLAEAKQLADHGCLNNNAEACAVAEALAK